MNANERKIKLSKRLASALQSTIYMSTARVSALIRVGRRDIIPHKRTTVSVLSFTTIIIITGV